MNILDVEKEEYKKLVVNPFSKFDTVEFVELNKHKVDEVKYFIFNNGKNRFALIAGIKDGVLKSPFSATFGIFSEITKENKIEYYYEAINELINWAKTNNIKQIQINTPALSYSEPHITKFQNALINSNFRILNYDINFEFHLNKFNENNYIETIQRNARKNLKNALNNNLKFEKTDNIKLAYEIIKINRSQKGYPLWMSLNDVKNTNDIIKSDYFLISTSDNKPIASAYIHHLTDYVYRVVYWGNLMEDEQLRPINFLAYNLLKYYKNSQCKILDIGTSTLDSVANFGLCDFKESIGCTCSPKLSFILKDL